MRFPAVALALSCWALLGLGGMRIDELECESAVAHLRTCCAELDVQDQYACDYAEGCDTIEYPVLSEAESRCIQNTPCDSPEMADVCARADAVFAGEPVAGEVCP